MDKNIHYDDNIVINLQREIIEIKQRINILENKEKKKLNVANKILKDYKTITFKLDKELHNQLIKFANQEGYKIQSILNKAVEEILDKYFDEEIEL